MTKEDMEWEIYKLLVHHMERRIRTERKLELAMYILIILGMLVYQSEEEAFAMPYIGLKLPRTFLMVTMPVIVSALYNIVLSLSIVNEAFVRAIKQNLLRLAGSQEIQLSDDQEHVLLRIRAPSFYMSESMAYSGNVRWVALVTMGLQAFVSVLLPLVAIAYFLSQSWSQTCLWIWVATVLISLFLVTISVISTFKISGAYESK